MMRSIIFWLHLVFGVSAGIVIAVMSITGIAIAFEEEILAWCDRNVAAVQRPQDGRRRLSADELHSVARQRMPHFAPDHLVVHRDPQRAWQFFAGHSGPVYIDPYTGQMRESQARAADDAFHFLGELHRWLAMSDGRRATGRFITGVGNLVFLFLCVTGFYLWFPRRWSVRALKPRLLLKWRARGRVRDFNWHVVLGFWSLPVLVVLVVTGVVISFGWAHNLVFQLFGEKPAEHRDFRMTLVPPVAVPAPAEGSERLPLESLLAELQAGFPAWKSIRLPLGSPRNADETASVKAVVTMPDYMPNRANVPVELDPYTGEILRALHLRDRSAGLQARIWIRFLHTGAAFGVAGKIVAVLSTAASLLLVYTGYALSYRRFFPKKRAVRSAVKPLKEACHALQTNSVSTQDCELAGLDPGDSHCDSIERARTGVRLE